MSSSVGERKCCAPQEPSRLSHNSQPCTGLVKNGSLRPIAAIREWHPERRGDPWTTPFRPLLSRAKRSLFAGFRSLKIEGRFVGLGSCANPLTNAAFCSLASLTGL